MLDKSAHLHSYRDSVDPPWGGCDATPVPGSAQKKQLRRAVDKIFAFDQILAKFRLKASGILIGNVI